MRPPLMWSMVVTIFAPITGLMNCTLQVAMIWMFCVTAASPAAQVNVSN